MIEVSKVMRNTLIDLMKKGKRLDERKLDEYRDIKVGFNVSKNAEGSCEVKIGKTHVVVGVKIDIGEPFLDSPDSGILVVNAELLPLAYAGFEPGPPGIDAIELARLVDRGIRESEIIDMKKLCLEKGKKVYCVFIDIYPLNYDGNLIDASFLAAVLALKKSVLPKVEKEGDEFKIIYGERTKQKLPLTDTTPIMATVYKISDVFFLDPCLVEEKASDARISIAFSFGRDKVSIHAMQKGGEDVFSLEELKQVIELAQKGAKHMKKFLI